MQTLKTAAIVVLLMTVMYGAYVSLTTPPEPLPGEAEDMLVINEEGSLAIDVGLPASLGDLDFGDEATAAPESTPTPSGGSPGNADASAYGPDLAAINFPGGAGVSSDAGVTGSVTTELDDQTVTHSLSDSTAAAEAAMAGMASGTPGLGNPTGNVAAQASASNAPQRQYPRTNNTFELPDPTNVASGFDADAGNASAAAGGASDQAANLALTSGTSDVPPKASDLRNSPPGTSGDLPSPNLGLANAIRIADRQYAEDKRKDALASLSLFYHTPNLPGEQRSELLARLDPLAREVIYSKRHLLEQPYRVGQNETLMDVAQRYEVPWQLLANINQIDDPVTVLPGTELKVVRGPFRAEVNLSLKELTLFLGDLYAGRFPIAIGNDPAPQPGTFTIQDKQTERTYYDSVGNPVAPGSRDNPYGDVWLDLGGNLCIHGSPSTTEPTEKGCISLAADYAQDLYGILSQGSSVTIRR